MKSDLRILHLEDDADDAELIRGALSQAGLAAAIRVVRSRPEYLAALAEGGFDLILSDHSLPGIQGTEALQLARQRYQGVPFLFVSGHLGDADQMARLKAAGASGCLPKSELRELAAVLDGILQGESRVPAGAYLQAMERLVGVVQELSLARDLDTVMAIVRRAARELTGADGATFVLRDGDLCHYADEDAIAPLWKGRRFPMAACISGWVMLNRQPVVLEDIYADSRIPHDAYRPTFVKSLAMVPIRTLEPIGAIGNYWARHHRASPETVKLLQALADTTAVALENVQVYAELERRVRERTAELEAANKELEAFSYAVSHDLRAPLRHLEGFSRMLVRDCAERLDEKGNFYLSRIDNATRRMGQLIEDLLTLSRATRSPVRRQVVDLSRLAREILTELSEGAPERSVDWTVAGELLAEGDANLLRAVLENLLGNAWKFTGKRPRALIEVGAVADRPEAGQTAYFVRDNGAGFDMAYADKLFGVFQRLHADSDFPGTGVGLATVQRIIHKHGGKIWAEAAPDEGASFFFTLG